MAIASAPEPLTRRMTEEEFLNLPDDGRKYELVEGEPREVPAGFEHDIIGIIVAVLLQPYAKGRGYIAGSQAGFRMSGGNLRSPDISFTLKSRLSGGKPGKGFGDFAPDLCIEIISPNEDQADMQTKLIEYFASGAQLVWQLFPEQKSIRIYTAPNIYQEKSADEQIDAGALLPGFHCLVSDLFNIE